MDTIREIQDVRRRLIREIDATFERLIQEIKNNINTLDEENYSENYDVVYQLSTDPGLFKGKKPTMLFFGDEMVPVYTWKMVFKEVMNRCKSSPEKHKALMNLRMIISGRTRVILSDKPDGMRSPLKLDNKLYAETHYDTETLIRILLHRILDTINYDYNNISVAIRSGT